MIKRIKQRLRLAQKTLTFFIKEFSDYFYKGWKARLMGPYVYSFAHSLFFYLNQFRVYLYVDGIQLHQIKEKQIKRLEQTARDLHSLLPPQRYFSYSILIPVNQPRLDQFQETVDSALSQSAPQMEILIGFMNPLSKELEDYLNRVKEENRERVKVISCLMMKERAQVCNALADLAAGHFLFFLEEEDWIRPDCLFRFEQTLQIFPDPEKWILYSNLNEITDKGYFLPNSEHIQPKELQFPYFFSSMVAKGMLISHALWKKIGGFNLSSQEAKDEDLLFRLDCAGAQFQHLPFSLYSIRRKEKKNQRKKEESEQFEEAFLRASENYSEVKGLGWKWTKGFLPGSLRAIPPLPSCSIQVIIPYKDQKELTMKCIQSLLKQHILGKELRFQITAVDNRSMDQSIREEIEALGGEVLSIQEPFNY